MFGEFFRAVPRGVHSSGAAQFLTRICTGHLPQTELPCNRCCAGCSATCHSCFGHATRMCYAECITCGAFLPRWNSGNCKEHVVVKVATNKDM